MKPGAGSPEIVITDFPDEDLLQPRVGTQAFDVLVMNQSSFRVAEVVCCSGIRLDERQKQNDIW